MASGVEIAGVGIHSFGRFADKSVVELGVVAVRNALRDAGVSGSGFQSAFCGTVYSGVAAGHKVLTALGMTGMPIVNVENACSSGGAAWRWNEAIRSRTVLSGAVAGIEKMPRGIIRSTSSSRGVSRRAGRDAGVLRLRAQRLMRDSGVTREHLARVSVKNHRNGVHNPHAMFRKEFSLEQVLRRRWFANRSRCTCCARPTRAQPRRFLQRARGGAGRSPVAAAALRSHLRQRTRRAYAAGGLDATTPLRLPPSWQHGRPTKRQEWARPISTSSSCRTQTPPARFSPYEELGLCPKGEIGRVDRLGQDGDGRRDSSQPERRLALQGRAAGCVRSRADHRAVLATPRRGGARQIRARSWRSGTR